MFLFTLYSGITKFIELFFTQRSASSKVDCNNQAIFKTCLGYDRWEQFVWFCDQKLTFSTNRFGIFCLFNYCHLHQHENEECFHLVLSQHRNHVCGSCHAEPGMEVLDLGKGSKKKVWNFPYFPKPTHPTRLVWKKITWSKNHF